MRTTTIAALLLAVLLPVGCRSKSEYPVDLTSQRWQAQAIAYSGYRDGQSPESEVRPSREQVEQDLRILASNWQLIRIYSADRHSEDVLESIRQNEIDLKVMLGIWLDREPGHEESNAREIAEGIRLANEYEDLIVAVNVGNEVLIEWTEHPVREETVIRYVRQVQAGVDQPVTVADNYVWWRDFGSALAREVDFITIHTYPLWERRDIDEGLSFTIENYEQVRAAHPGRTVVIGEAGWATYTEGNLHVPRGGDEAKQRRYYEELMAWARAENVTVFFFEAFDEPWKGSGTEGHWGLFTVDRKAKPVMRELYPELVSDGPTSPDHPERIEASGPDIASVLRADVAGRVPNGSVNPMGPGLSTAGVASIEGEADETALQLDFSDDGWAGVYFFLESFDASGSRALNLRMKRPDQVARLELKLEGPEGNVQSVELNAYESERDASGWVTYSVPLSEFDRIDFSRLAIVGLWNPSGPTGARVRCRILVDDLHFE